MRYLQNAQLRVDNKQLFTIAGWNNEIIVVLLTDLCDPGVASWFVGCVFKRADARTASVGCGLWSSGCPP